MSEIVYTFDKNPSTKFFDQYNYEGIIDYKNKDSELIKLKLDIRFTIRAWWIASFAMSSIELSSDDKHDVRYNYGLTNVPFDIAQTALENISEEYGFMLPEEVYDTRKKFRSAALQIINVSQALLASPQTGSPERYRYNDDGTKDTLPYIDAYYIPTLSSSVPAMVAYRYTEGDKIEDIVGPASEYGDRVIGELQVKASQATAKESKDLLNKYIKKLKNRLYGPSVPPMQGIMNILKGL